ncbi:MAG: hypothetical protein IT379_20685 [Deltaproteobacteria bacterium]|nr:hypothetical protein [Deltaproteobacteria bacterium]
MAEATVATRLTRRALVHEANLVVHARVESRAVVPERGPRGEIYTRSTLRVLRTLEGQAPETVVVQQLGGTLGGLTMHVEGNARLEPGDEVVAFLDHDPARGVAYVVGLAQGVYRVVRGRSQRATVERDLSGISFYEPTAGAPTIDHGPRETAEPLDALLREVARLVREERSATSSATVAR